MKSLLLFFFCIFHFAISFSQVSVGPTIKYKQKKFKPETLKKFKNSTTIFVLSDKYSEEQYYKLLKEVWTVTPFKIINFKDFKILDYIGEEHSIFRINASQISDNNGTYLTTSIDLKIYNEAQIKKKVSKLSESQVQKKILSVLDYNSNYIARIGLYSNSKFRLEPLGDMYSNDVFHNYNLGLLKNYFQKVNTLLLSNKTNSMYEGLNASELAKLSSESLYVPSYMETILDPFTGAEIENEIYLKNLLENYKYKYEYIITEDLGKKILNNENIYYLRYCRINSERFLSVVNSKTGEILYNDHISGLSYKLKPKHIQELNQKIEFTKKINQFLKY